MEPRYELNPIKRRCLDKALRDRKDALLPGRMDELEDLHLKQALRQSMDDEQRCADVSLLISSTTMRPVLLNSILGYLSPSDLLAMAVVDTNLNQVIQTYSEGKFLALTKTNSGERYGRFLQFLEERKSVTDQYAEIIGPAQELAWKWGYAAKLLPYRCALRFIEKQEKLMASIPNFLARERQVGGEALVPQKVNAGKCFLVLAEGIRPGRNNVGAKVAIPARFKHLVGNIVAGLRKEGRFRNTKTKVREISNSGLVGPLLEIPDIYLEPIH